MRTAPLVGKKPWFGPRRFGWGLSPITTEGWIVMAVLVSLSLVARRRWPDRPLARALPGIGLLIVSLAKGTSPGGSKARSLVMSARESSAGTEQSSDAG
jgi:hypothetical protein